MISVSDELLREKLQVALAKNDDAAKWLNRFLASYKISVVTYAGKKGRASKQVSVTFGGNTLGLPSALFFMLMTHCGLTMYLPSLWNLNIDRFKLTVIFKPVQ